jgi:4-azaleucine resistance transporter AzlC
MPDGTHRESEWLRGVSLAGPIVIGYIPIGFAYGVLAQKSGLSAWNTLLMSILVYAGSSQLIAVGLFAVAAPALSVIATTFVVNLRHMLMAAALSPYLKHWRLHELAVFAYELTDETFAVHSLRFPAGPVSKRSAIAINLTAQVSWVFGGGLGILAGQLIADVKPFGLDYALPAMFIALLILQIKDRVQAGLAFFAGLLSVALVLAGLDRWSVIVATLVGATVGVGVEQWTKKRS